jgi:hypothetical protein
MELLKGFRLRRMAYVSSSASGSLPLLVSETQLSTPDSPNRESSTQVCMVCDKDIGGGKEWIMANNKRHCSVACAQRSAAVFDMARPPKDSREPTAVYLCTIT